MMNRGGMEHVQLSNEEEDDLYGGFNQQNTLFDTDDLYDDVAFQQAVKTSHGRRPPTSLKVPGGRLGTAVRGTARQTMPSSMGRMSTAMQGEGSRPITAVRRAGYSSKKDSMDPLNLGTKQTLLETKEETPEEKVRLLEKKVHELIEESCIANERGEHQLALQKAKEAERTDKELSRRREQQESSEQANVDLAYLVLLNMAVQYEANQMYKNALDTYNLIIKNKIFAFGGRLRVNMGNIYFKQKDYSRAAKMYRMALDQIQNTYKDLRFQVQQNIGISLVKLGQYSDAIVAFDQVMQEKPEFRTGLNLILCYLKLGDRDKVKKAFMRLLQVPMNYEDDEKYRASTNDKKYNTILEAIRDDSLRKIERERRAVAEKCIMNATKLVAPAVQESGGFDWCLEQVRLSRYSDLAHDLEMGKAIAFLREKKFDQAIEVLKAFEKKDTRAASTAAINLSFIFFLEKDTSQAEKYAEVALTADRYNPAALTNRGNCYYAQGEYEKSREFYKEALKSDSSCVEAIYNLGLAEKQMGLLEEALETFFKLNKILRNNAQVQYQIADIFEKSNDPGQAVEWFSQVLTLVPQDPGLLQRLGELFDRQDDPTQAYQYHFDSYRLFPSNIEVIEWLGGHFVSKMPEKAISFFERAALVQPQQMKWPLLIAGSYRRGGNYPRALEEYKKVHQRFPDNTECLKFLVKICTDLGMKEAQEYANLLKKAERSKEARDQRTTSGSRRVGSGQSRNGSATSEASSRDSSARHRDAGSARKPVRVNLDNSEDAFKESNQDIDSSYHDPLGPQMERPKTAANKRKDQMAGDEFGDEELGDELLPE